MGRKVTQMDVARTCRLDQGSVSRILNKDKRDSFSSETIRRVFKIAREIGYVHPSLISSNRRESDRHRIFLKARIRIVIGLTTVFDEGTAEIDEVSVSGMRLVNFKTGKGVLPLDQFRFDIHVSGPKLKGFSCRARLVRFLEMPEQFALAVKYENLSDEHMNRLDKYLA